MDGVPDAPWVSRTWGPLGPPTWSYRAVRHKGQHHSHAMVRRERGMRATI